MQEGGRSFPNAFTSYRIYSARTHTYIVGMDGLQQEFSLLKAPKAENLTSLRLQEGEKRFPMRHLETHLEELRPGPEGWLHVTQAVALLGFISFVQGYYCILIQKTKKVGHVLGHHNVHAVEKTHLYPLFDPQDPSLSDSRKEEAKYKELIEKVELSRGLYFSHSYDLSRSLQTNFALEAARRAGVPLSSSSVDDDPGTEEIQSGEVPHLTDRGDDPRHRERETGSPYMWNYHHISPMLRKRKWWKWITPVIFGFFMHARCSSFGRALELVLLARRSRFYVGTRYKKRGINADGKPANDVETEQIVFDYAGGQGAMSFVQVRASVPLFWSQEASAIMPKPPITYSVVDPSLSGTRQHIQDLYSRYGCPVIAVNLMRATRNSDEGVLGKKFQDAVTTLNKELPPEHPDVKVQFVAMDIRTLHKKQQDAVYGELTSLADKIVSQVSYFYTTSASHRPLRVQSGVARTNCVDCLDRTNVMQFFLGRAALAHHLAALAFVPTARLDFDGHVVSILSEMFDEMGDQIALQYGGSIAHKKYGALQRTLERPRMIKQSKEVLTSLTRHYNNSFGDAEKQSAFNLLLGVLNPRKHPKPWVVDADAWLHHRPVLDAYAPGLWWLEPLRKMRARLARLLVLPPPRRVPFPPQTLVRKDHLSWFACLLPYDCLDGRFPFTSLGSDGDDEGSCEEEEWEEDEEDFAEDEGGREREQGSGGHRVRGGMQRMSEDDEDEEDAETDMGLDSSDSSQGGGGTPRSLCTVRPAWPKDNQRQLMFLQRKWGKTPDAAVRLILPPKDRGGKHQWAGTLLGHSGQELLGGRVNTGGEMPSATAAGVGGAEGTTTGILSPGLSSLPAGDTGMGDRGTYLASSPAVAPGVPMPAPSVSEGTRDGNATLKSGGLGPPALLSAQSAESVASDDTVIQFETMQQLGQQQQQQGQPGEGQKVPGETERTGLVSRLLFPAKGAAEESVGVAASSASATAPDSFRGVGGHPGGPLLSLSKTYRVSQFLLMPLAQCVSPETFRFVHVLLPAQFREGKKEDIPGTTEFDIDRDREIRLTPFEEYAAGVRSKSPLASHTSGDLRLLSPLCADMAGSAFKAFHQPHLLTQFDEYPSNSVHVKVNSSLKPSRLECSRARSFASSARKTASDPLSTCLRPPSQLEKSPWRVVTGPLSRSPEEGEKGAYWLASASSVSRMVDPPMPSSEDVREFHNFSNLHELAAVGNFFPHNPSWRRRNLVDPLAALEESFQLVSYREGSGGPLRKLQVLREEEAAKALREKVGRKGGGGDETPPPLQAGRNVSSTPQQQQQQPAGSSSTRSPVRERSVSQTNPQTLQLPGQQQQQPASSPWHKVSMRLWPDEEEAGEMGELKLTAANDAENGLDNRSLQSFAFSLERESEEQSSRWGDGEDASHTDELGEPPEGRELLEGSQMGDMGRSLSPAGIMSGGGTKGEGEGRPLVLTGTEVRAGAWQILRRLHLERFGVSLPVDPSPDALERERERERDRRKGRHKRRSGYEDQTVSVNRLSLVSEYLKRLNERPGPVSFAHDFPPFVVHPLTASPYEIVYSSLHGPRDSPAVAPDQVAEALETAAEHSAARLGLQRHSAASGWKGLGVGTPARGFTRGGARLQQQWGFKGQMVGGRSGTGGKDGRDSSRRAHPFNSSPGGDLGGGFLQFEEEGGGSRSLMRNVGGIKGAGVTALSAVLEGTEGGSVGAQEEEDADGSPMHAVDLTEETVPAENLGVGGVPVSAGGGEGSGSLPMMMRVSEGERGTPGKPHPKQQQQQQQQTENLKERERETSQQGTKKANQGPSVLPGVPSSSPLLPPSHHHHHHPHSDSLDDDTLDLSRGDAHPHSHSLLPPSSSNIRGGTTHGSARPLRTHPAAEVFSDSDERGPKTSNSTLDGPSRRRSAQDSETRLLTRRPRGGHMRTNTYSHSPSRHQNSPPSFPGTFPEESLQPVSVSGRKDPAGPLLRGERREREREREGDTSSSSQRTPPSMSIRQRDPHAVRLGFSSDDTPDVHSDSGTGTQNQISPLSPTANSSSVSSPPSPSRIRQKRGDKESVSEEMLEEEEEEEDDTRIDLEELFRKRRIPEKGDLEGD